MEWYNKFKKEQIICNFLQSSALNRERMWRKKSIFVELFRASHKLYLSLMKIELHQQQVEIKHENKSKWE